MGGFPPAPPAPHRRLNPFAFPAETDLRFILLILSAVILAVNVGYLVLALVFPDYAQVFLTPAAAAPTDVASSQFLEQNQAFLSGQIRYALVNLILPTAMTIALLGLALVLYRLHPRLLLRRAPAAVIDPHKDAHLIQKIAELSGRASLTAQPEVVLGPGFAGQSGQAFGLPGHYAIRLDGGMRLLLRKAYSAFQAIVLHEMAHLANRDVGKTYFAQAIWVAAVILAIVPFGLAALVNLVARAVHQFNLLDWITHVIPTLLLLSFQVLVTLVLVLVIRAGLLRTREIYADWRASTWGAEAGLAGILQSEAVRRLAPSRRSPLQRLRDNLLRLHPTPGQRLAALHDPASLFHLSLDLPLVTGALVGLLFSGIVWFIMPVAIAVAGIIASASSWLARMAGSYPAGVESLLLGLAFLAGLVGFITVLALLLLPFLGLALLVAGALGLPVQKEAIAEMVAPSSPNRLVRWLRSAGRDAALAGLFSLGLEAGILISPGSTGYALAWSSLFRWLLWAIITVTVIWLCLGFMRWLAFQVFGRHTGPRLPRWKGRFSSLFSGLLLASALVLVFVAHQWAQNRQSFPWQLVLVALLVFGALFAILSVGTWVFLSLVRWLRPLTCPHCRQITRQPFAPGRSCEHCRQELAAWLLVNRLEERLL